VKRQVLILVLSIATCSVLISCRKKAIVAASDPLRNAYDSEVDWNDPQRLIPLGYEAAQGKRLFYQYCVWCHADATPAGPSNRSNLTPNPLLLNDGTILNSESDDFLQNITALGGSAVGRSAMMPAYGKTLSQEDIRCVIAYVRAIAVPSYEAPAQGAPKYPAR
jgi:mono/diheme cytochrome c family protein